MQGTNRRYHWRLCPGKWWVCSCFKVVEEGVAVDKAIDPARGSSSGPEGDTDAGAPVSLGE